MSRYKILIIVFLVVLTSCQQAMFRSISKEVDALSKKDQKMANNLGRPTFHEVRMKVYKAWKPPILSAHIDTLYILEMFNLEEFTSVGKIWNSEGNVDYRYSDKKLDSSRKDGFTKFMVETVQKWDIATIKSEERLYGNSIPSVPVHATRVITNDKRVKIDTLSFDYFIKVERDSR